jgi:hypothetical protein
MDPDQDPDPLVRVTDPGIRIHTKLSRIPNTGFSDPHRNILATILPLLFTIAFVLTLLRYV